MADSFNLQDTFTQSTNNAHHKAQTQEVQNQVTAVMMGKLDPSQVTNSLALSIAKTITANAKNSDKEASETWIHLMVLESIKLQIEMLETQLEARYGEDFAEHLLADFTEQGIFTEDEQKALMSITDQEERRQAIAKAIQDKIDQGLISDADLADLPPEIKQWLELRQQQELSMQVQGIKAAQDIHIAKNASTDVKDEAVELLHSDTDNEARATKIKDQATSEYSTEAKSSGVSIARSL